MTLKSISCEHFLLISLYKHPKQKLLYPSLLFQIFFLDQPKDAVDTAYHFSFLIHLFSKSKYSFFSIAIHYLILFLQSQSALLKTSMSNNYPQIAVLGCGSNKANLYYDIQRHVWVEHLVSSCIDDETSILEFCQKVNNKINLEKIIQMNISFFFLQRLIHHLISVISFDLILY